jgi:hypothetical protein
MRILPLLALPLLAGCTANTGRLTGSEGPLPLERTQWSASELNPHGAQRLVRTHQGDVLLVRQGKLDRLRGKAIAWSSAQVVGRTLYTRDKDRLVARRISGSYLGKATTVTQRPGLRSFLVTPEGTFLADSQTLVHRSQAQETSPTLVRARVEHMAWDAPRGLLWTVQSEPFAVVEALTPRGESRYVLPLPLELEGASVEILCSGDLVAIYAHDRPLSAGLLVRPKTGHCWTLRGGPRPAHTEGSNPTLIVPPGREVEGRITLDTVATEFGFGRLAPLERGFLLIDDERTAGGPSLSEIRDAGSDAAPRHFRREVPGGWPRAVQVVAWDDEGVTLIAGRRLLRITPDDQSSRRLSGTAWSVFARVMNSALTLPLTVYEVGVALGMNAAAGSVATVVSPLALVFGDPDDFVTCFTAGVWLPLGGTFDLIDNTLLPVLPVSELDLTPSNGDTE